MERRDFLKITAAAPALVLLPRIDLETKKPSMNVQSWAGSLEVTAPVFDSYSSHVQFCGSLPFHAQSLTIKVVPKFKCWNELGNGNTYCKNKGELVPVNALMDLHLGACGSELAYLKDLHLAKDHEYWIPFTIPKGSRVTVRLKDSVLRPTRYKVHMAIAGA